MRGTIVPNVKIAVVEHEKLTREFIVNVMMYCVNREIMAFENGEGLLAYLQAGGNINLVLAETQLTGISGLNLLQSIKKSFPEIVFVTMSANPADETPASELGADAFLGKPFALRDMFDIVQQFVVGD